MKTTNHVPTASDKLKLSNAIAAFNGYNNGLSVDWMSSMAGASKSTIYRQIILAKKLLTYMGPK